MCKVKGHVMNMLTILFFKLVPCTLVLGMAVIATAAPEPVPPPCPSSPNCVSSRAQDSHFIEPLRFSGDGAVAFAGLRDILAKRSDARIISADDSTIRVEFRTLLGFVDDGRFDLDAPISVIQVRSAARVGYWDLGKNRRRMEEIRQQFKRWNGKHAMNQHDR
jgi:uncharacterized protein (DUF1499 family)